MDENKGKNFAISLSITLGTIVIGLISFIVFTNISSSSKEAPKCEYNGWAYSDKEIFESADKCNTCFCHTGETVCTKKICESTVEKDLPLPIE